jgi:hypothetical protein
MRSKGREIAREIAREPLVQLTVVCETSFKIDFFLANTKTRVGREIAIPPPFGHDTK